MQQAKKKVAEKKKKKIHPLMRLLFDTHCHPQDDTCNVDLIPQLPVAGLCLIGVRDIDWPVVEELHSRYGDKVRAAFAVHPWYAHRRGSDWLEELEALLRRNPAAIVGEIGLDRAATTPDTGRCEHQHQLEVFEKQFRLAGRLQRPVSIHCVRAFGQFFEAVQQILKEDGKMALPPSIIMHSYGGTAGMMDSLTTMKQGIGSRFYFSFSPVINMRSPKTVEVIKHIPQDRLLIETDQNTPTSIEDDIMEMCEIVAKARGWSVEQAARITLENAQRVFDFPRIAPGPPEMDDDEGAFASLAGLRVRDDDEAKANATSNEKDDDEEEEEEDDSDGASSGWWVKRP